jgi:hypothetical protein
MSFSASRTEGEVINLEKIAGVSATNPTDALLAFDSEAGTDSGSPASVSAPRAPHPTFPSRGAVAVSLPARTERPQSPSRWAVFLLATVAVAEAPFVALWVEKQATVAATHGTVFVETEPSGAEVRIDGDVVGRTPTRLSIPPGAAAIELRHEGSVRVLPLMIAPEETVRLRVELPTSPAESAELPGDIAGIRADNLSSIVPDGTTAAVAPATDAGLESGPLVVAPVSVSPALVEPRVE